MTSHVFLFLVIVLFFVDTALQAFLHAKLLNGLTKADAKEVEARRLHEQVLASAKLSFHLP